MSFPSHYRILLLVSVLVGLSLLDLRKPADERTRFKQYGTVLLLGIIGLFFGLITDTITSSISPDYFILAKGIRYDDSFLFRVWWFGGQAGFAAFAFFDFFGFAALAGLSFLPDFRLNTVALSNWCLTVF